MPSTKKKHASRKSTRDAYTSTLREQQATMRAGIRANKRTRELALALARAEAGAERALRNVRVWLNEKFAAGDISAIAEEVNRASRGAETH